MKLLILDRDGVINHDSDAYIKSPDEWRPIEGSPEAIARFTNAGWRVMVATNQSGIGRGLFDLETLASIHAKMHATVQAAGGQIDAVFFCPHPDSAQCECRKPRPGMILEILSRTGAAPTDVIMVGDSLRDMEAGQAAGVRTVLVLTGNGQRTLQNNELPNGTQVRVSLAALAQELLP
ncbi:MAG: D-glycero-beta-D-manno-heptose 1,7-bisphosphate 7-phosphatase [Burkholderiaceae bacterium]